MAWTRRLAEAIVRQETGLDKLDDGLDQILVEDREKIIVDFAPKCETCARWTHYDHHAKDVGLCEMLGLRTKADFGCVVWKAK